MKWLQRELTKQARDNRQDDKAFLQFAREEKRRKLECRLRELREERARMGAIHKEVKS